MGKPLIPSCGPAYDRFFKVVNQYVVLMCDGADPGWTHCPKASFWAWSLLCKLHT
jgi:hypothetical protein